MRLFGIKKRLLVVCCLWPVVAQGFIAPERWDDTATQAENGGWGDPITLTWSFAPNGTLVPAVGGASNLVARLDEVFGAGGGTSDLSQRPWFHFFENAFGRWQELGSARFVWEPADDGLLGVALSNFPGELNHRGDIRIGGGTIDGPGGILASTGLVNEADMVFDTSDLNGLFDPASNYLTFRNTLYHEIGHTLGLKHLLSGNAALLMEPSLNLLIEGPQLDDIRGLHRLYGDARETPTDNNIFSRSTQLGLLAPGGTLSVGSDAGNTQLVDLSMTDFVSISSDVDEDWFSFEIDAPATVTLTLTPLGGSFSQQPEAGGPVEPIDATAANDLALAAFGPFRSPLGGAMPTAAGQTEVIANLELPEAGTYYAQVLGLNDAAQLYELSISSIAMLVGDFNGDGMVDAADYNVWRDAQGTTGTGLAADANGDSIVDTLDYQLWRANFGQSLAASVQSPAVVPEPTASGLTAIVIALAYCWHLRRRGPKGRFFAHHPHMW